MKIQILEFQYYFARSFWFISDLLVKLNHTSVTPLLDFL